MRTFFMFILVLCIAITSFAQKHSASYYEDETLNLANRFYQPLVVESSWRPYEREIDDLIEEMDDDLKSGSGLSFEDMNKVRFYRSTITTLKEFGDGVATGGYNKMFNGRSLKRIRELFPVISFELLRDTSCVSFYRITIKNYVVIVARHNERGIMREISWWDNARRCKTLGGSFTLYPGVYRQVWNNSECPTYNGSGIVIKGCSFKMYWDRAYDIVKSFVEE